MPTQRPLRFTARVTVEIEDYTQLATMLIDSLAEVVRAVAPPPPAPAPPLQPICEPVQIKPVPVPPDLGQENLLLDTKQVAKLLDIGERTLWRYWNSGRVLKPIKIGNAVRWNASELRQWVEAGCPRHERWEKRRRG